MMKLLCVVLAAFSAAGLLGAVFPSIDRASLQVGEYHLRWYWLTVVGLLALFYRAVDD